MRNSGDAEQLIATYFNPTSSELETVLQARIMLHMFQQSCQDVAADPYFVLRRNIISHRERLWNSIQSLPVVLSLTGTGGEGGRCTLGERGRPLISDLVGNKTKGQQKED